jgi:hypothetical protein
MEEIKAEIVHVSQEPCEDEIVVSAHFDCGYTTVVEQSGTWYLRSDENGHMLRINKELASYAIKRLGADNAYKN